MKEIAYILQIFVRDGTLPQVSRYGRTQHQQYRRTRTVCDQARNNLTPLALTCHHPSFP
jgi:hypothetical protein